MLIATLAVSDLDKVMTVPSGASSSFTANIKCNN